MFRLIIILAYKIVQEANLYITKCLLKKFGLIRSVNEGKKGKVNFSFRLLECMNSSS